jgi:hypothetical protein
MTVRLSTQLRTNMAGSTGFAASFANGVIEFYSGSQPATADAAVTGTLLGTATQSSGAYTAETLASQTITVAGASGSINTVTVGTFNIIPLGAVTFRTDASTTASDLADAINRNGVFRATVVGAVVTVLAPSGSGTAYNGLALATTVTTLTATSGGNMSGGVAAANGLTFAVASSGAVSKSGVWSFNGVAVGTAGWFRLKADVADAGALSTTAVRLDGSVATSGADLNLSNITIAIGAPNTIDTFTFTIPAA